jgi:thiol:disulfide interchange protein DsbD
MLRASHTLAAITVLCLSAAAQSGNPVTWSFSSVKAGADTVQVQLSASCAPGWHFYATGPETDEGPLPTVFHLTPGTGYELAGPLEEPAPQEKLDRAFGMQVRLYEGSTTFIQAVKRTTAEAFTVKGSVEFMACNDQTCLPPHSVPFTLDIPPSH